MTSLRGLIDAVQAFGERLAAVHWGFLVLAASLGFANLALRSRGWQNILRAAFPGELIRYRTAFGAYCAGVGVNAVIPARAGDLMKMYLVRRVHPNAGYATLTGSLVCETLVDVFIASGLLVWALPRASCRASGSPTSRRSTCPWRCATRSGRSSSPRFIGPPS